VLDGVGVIGKAMIFCMTWMYTILNYHKRTVSRQETTGWELEIMRKQSLASLNKNREEKETEKLLGSK